MTILEQFEKLADFECSAPVYGAIVLSALGRIATDIPEGTQERIKPLVNRLRDLVRQDRERTDKTRAYRRKCVNNYRQRNKQKKEGV